MAASSDAGDMRTPVVLKELVKPWRITYPQPGSARRTGEEMPSIAESETRPDEAFDLDLPTRVFHWALAGSFLAQYVLAEQTSCDPCSNVRLHRGRTDRLPPAVGPHRFDTSRFRDFCLQARRRRSVPARSRDRRARDYDGHNPAAAWAIYDWSPSQREPHDGWLHTMKWVARRWRSCTRCSRMRGWCWSRARRGVIVAVWRTDGISWRR